MDAAASADAARATRRRALGTLAAGLGGALSQGLGPVAALGTLAACGAAGQPQQTQWAAPSAAVVDVLVQSRRAGSGVSEVEYWLKIVARFNERQRKGRGKFEAFPPDRGPQVLAVAG